MVERCWERGFEAAVGKVRLLKVAIKHHFKWPPQGITSALRWKWGERPEEERESTADLEIVLQNRDWWGAGEGRGRWREKSRCSDNGNKWWRSTNVDKCTKKGGNWSNCGPHWRMDPNWGKCSHAPMVCSVKMIIKHRENINGTGKSLYHGSAVHCTIVIEICFCLFIHFIYSIFIVWEGGGDCKYTETKKYTQNSTKQWHHKIIVKLQ